MGELTLEKPFNSYFVWDKNPEPQIMEGGVPRAALIRKGEVREGDGRALHDLVGMWVGR